MSKWYSYFVEYVTLADSITEMFAILEQEDVGIHRLCVRVMNLEN